MSHFDDTFPESLTPSLEEGRGSEVWIHRTAEVSDQARLGSGCRVWHFAQVREFAELGEDCSLGKEVYIDTGVQVGRRVRVQNGVSLFRGIIVGDDVFIGPHSTFTNDRWPRANTEDFQPSSTRLERGCSIGANATILCGITLGEYCMIAAGAVVTRSTLPYGLYVGNPARLQGFVTPEGHKLEMKARSGSTIVLASDVSGEELHLTLSLKPPS